MKNLYPGLQKDVILFSSAGQIGVINPDGSECHYLQFDLPNLRYCAFGVPFPDSPCLALHTHSQGEIKFEDGVLKENTILVRMWKYHLLSGAMTEIAYRNRPSNYMGVQGVLPGERKIITSALIKNRECLFCCNLDGSDPVQLTTYEDGYAYGTSLSPDGKKIAFHITFPYYRVWTMDVDGKNRKTIADHPEHLYFMPVWSPDGQWLAFQDCRYLTDPGHDWADLCVARADGSDLWLVTHGQSHWFGTSYGTPQARGGGSNTTQWSPDGYTLTYTCKIPGSRTAWVYAQDRPDNDHFNRDYQPEQARGGTQICLVNPFSGEETELTRPQEGVWDFRPAWRSDGTQLTFTRARVGEPSEIWIMNADGSDQRLLTTGKDGKGADFSRWIRLPAVQEVK